MIRECGAKSCANIILGIPGISERYALILFINTLSYVLNTAKFDYVLISPLINKKNTIGYILDGKESTISINLLENALYYIRVGIHIRVPRSAGML